jgi:hypothetical protein
MKKYIGELWHITVANAQVGITYFFLAGFFAMIGLQGAGVFKIDVTTKLNDVLMLVMSYWFMRQRTSEPKSNPTPPAEPAKVS